MINLKLKPKDVKKRAMKLIKRGKSIYVATESNKPSTAVRLPDVLLAAVCPSVAKTISQKEQEVNKKEISLQHDKRTFETEKNAWASAMAAEVTKQARVRRGAAVLFRLNRLHANAEKEEHVRTVNALEKELHAVQEELGEAQQERDEFAGALVAATAAQDAIAIKSKKEEEAIKNRLAHELEDAQKERADLQELATGLRIRSEKLDNLILGARTAQALAHEHLEVAKGQCHTLEALIASVQLRDAELDTLMVSTKAEKAETHHQLSVSQKMSVRFTIAAEAINLVSKTVNKEKETILYDANVESRKRLAALAAARAEFEKSRAREKESLANSRAHVEEMRTALVEEKRIVANEREKVRVLGVKAEQEHAASVDAKRAALGELERAIVMREEAKQASDLSKQQATEELQVAEAMKEECKWALDKLFSIASDMASPMPMHQDKNLESPMLKMGSGGIDGRMSRLDIYHDEATPGNMNETGEQTKAKAQCSLGEVQSNRKEIKPHGFGAAKSGKNMGKVTVTNENMPPTTLPLATKHRRNYLTRQDSKTAGALNTTAQTDDRKKFGRDTTKMANIDIADSPF